MKQMNGFLSKYKLFVFIGILLFMLIPSVACQESPDNHEGKQRYLVVFRDMRPEYKDEVLSIEGVDYVEDTFFNTPDHPAIVIYVTPEAVEEIKKLGFVTRVGEVEKSTIFEPIYITNPLEYTIRVAITGVKMGELEEVVPLVIFVLILVGIGFGLFYLVKRLRVSRR